jgi:PAS domain S-box-containing protein
MLRDVTERLASKNALRRSEQYSRELVLRSPVAMAVTRGPEYKNELINYKFTELFGYTIEDVPDEAHWWPLAYPDIEYRETVKAEWQRHLEKASQQGTEIEPMESMVRCKDGSSRWIEFHFATLKDTNLVSFVDITDRQQAQLELLESEGRFRLVANTAPVLIWMSGTDKLRTYFNKPWLDFTGRTTEQELGNGWLEGVHPDDLQRYLDSYTYSFERRQKFKMEYRLRRHDGEHRWVQDIGVPRFNPDGAFTGYIGSCNDVTDSRSAQEALAGVSRKLIEVQERERTRIARDLHDDIAQRIALLAIDIDELQQNLPDSPCEVVTRLEALQNQTSQLATDVQAISHGLHSSKLEYLGIVAAMRAFCREFAEKHQVEIDFQSHDLLDAVTSETSICLFRVLQEALQNAAKHSGVRHFDVELSQTSREIQLTIADHGSGFNPKAALNGCGLGLTSMQERLRLINGCLSIKSKPGRGTRVYARVPFTSKPMERAAG